MEETVHLLQAQPNKDAPAEQDFSLHEAARGGQAETLEKLLETKDPFVLDSKGRTPLHYAASCGNPKNALNCVQVLLNCAKVRGEVGERTKSFVDIQDVNKETALHLAAKNASQKVAEKLIFAAADVNFKSMEGKDPLSLIYSKVPSAMLPVLDRGVDIAEGDELTDEDLELLFDFGAIIGYFSEEEKDERSFYAKESQLLSYALDDCPKSSRDILTHPLVKLFLELKWQKIKYLFWISILFHIIWLVLYTVFITETYLLRCPYQVWKNTSEEDSRTEEEVLSKWSKFTWFGFSVEYQDVTDSRCEITQSCVWMAYFLLGMSGIIAGKEFFEIASSRKIRWYFTGVENLGQWTLIFSVVALCYPVLIAQEVQDWVYEVAAFGVFLAWSLILTQIGKYPRLGLHVEILARVLKSFAMFMLIFASLLIAFALSLSLLLPGNRSFVSLPLAFMKVVVMMTGELEYEDFFNGDNGENAFPVSGRIIYLFFVIVVSITLFNLLIGFTVSDIQVGQGLQQKAEVHTLSNQLEQIYLMESFILSRKMQMFLCSRRSFLKRFLVTPQLEGGGDPESDDFSVRILARDIPADLQRPIRSLAAMNAADSFDSGTNDDDDLEMNEKLIKQVVKQILRAKGLI